MLLFAIAGGRPAVSLSTPRATVFMDSQFPSANTQPEEVVSAQLQALSEAQLIRAYKLFSPARRAVMSGAGREAYNDLSPLDIQRRVRAALDDLCPGLIGHGSHEIISGLTLHGGLPRWRCRVKVDVFHADMYDDCDGGFLQAAAAAQPPLYFVFTLMQQSSSVCASEDAPCWFVWSIEPERRGGGGGNDNDDRPSDDPLPTRELPLPDAVLTYG